MGVFSAHAYDKVDTGANTVDYVRSKDAPITRSKDALNNSRKALGALQKGDVHKFFRCFIVALGIYRAELNRSNHKIDADLVRGRHGNSLRLMRMYGLVALGIPTPFRGLAGKPIRIGGNFAVREIPLLGPQAAVLINVLVYLAVSLWVGAPSYVTGEAIWQPIQAWALSTAIPLVGPLISARVQFDEKAYEIVEDWVIMVNVFRMDQTDGNEKHNHLYNILTAGLGQNQVDELRSGGHLDKINQYPEKFCNLP